MRTLNRDIECTLDCKVGDLYKLEGSFSIVLLELLFEENSFSGIASDTADAVSFLDEELDCRPVRCFSNVEETRYAVENSRSKQSGSACAWSQ